MLVHSVYFWLKKDLSDNEHKEFFDSIESLRNIQCADAVYVGTPGPTDERPVVDGTYSYGLTVILKDMEAHDAYQVSPEHQAFLAANKDKWEQVLVYDAI